MGLSDWLANTQVIILYCIVQKMAGKVLMTLLIDRRVPRGDHDYSAEASDQLPPPAG